MKILPLPPPDPNNPHIREYEKALERGEKSQHILLTKDHKWALRKGLSRHATKIFETQKEAIKFGKTVAKNKKTDLFIYSREGDIRKRVSYEV